MDFPNGNNSQVLKAVFRNACFKMTDVGLYLIKFEIFIRLMGSFDTARTHDDCFHPEALEKRCFRSKINCRCTVPCQFFA